MVMMNETLIHQRFHGETITQATNVHNRMVSAVLSMEIPTEMVMRRVPDSLNIGTFGCKAHVHSHKEQKRSTLDDKAEIRIYMDTRYGL